MSERWKVSNSTVIAEQRGWVDDKSSSFALFLVAYAMCADGKCDIAAAVCTEFLHRIAKEIDMS